MTYTEKVITFQCEDDLLFAILTLPITPAEIGVMVVVGGPQYRVGSHRQFVQLSRVVANAGFSVLRFDVRGMGDSLGEKKDFLHISTDIAAAKKHFLLSVPQLKGVVLWGLCDGASAALLYFHQFLDSQIHGLCLLNPWVRSESSLAINTVKHYYGRRLLQFSFWKKLFNGHISYISFIEAASNLIKTINSKIRKIKNLDNKFSKNTYQNNMASVWNSFNGKILLFLSKNDFIAKEFIDQTKATKEWGMKLNNNNYVCYEVENADHTFTNSESRFFVEQKTIEWIKTF
jgi:exosortase A-associated hydrolase 1